MLKASPQEKYKKPKYPTSSSFKPVTLRKLPARWQRSKRILLCLGAAGTLMLSGCLANGGNAPSERTEGVLNRITNRMPFGNAQIDQMFVSGRLMGIDQGGDGMMPLYVATFTEQEAINIIKREAAAAGLNLTVVEEERSFEIISRSADRENYRTRDVPIMFVDVERAIAISYIHAWAGFSTWGTWRDPPTPSMTEIVNNAAPEGSEAAIGVFLNPRGSGGLTSWEAFHFSWSLGSEISELLYEMEDELDPEQRRELWQEMFDERMSFYMDEFAANAFAEVERRIVLQMSDFIEWLEQQGILVEPS